MANSDLNTAIGIYLRTLYTVTNDDTETLVAQYVTANADGLNDATKVMQALIAAAVA